MLKKNYLGHSCIHAESPREFDNSLCPLSNSAEWWYWWVCCSSSIFSDLSKWINSVSFDPGPLTGDTLTEGMRNSAYHSQSWTGLPLLFLLSRSLSWCCQHTCNLCRASAHPLSFPHCSYLWWHKHTNMSSTTNTCVLLPLGVLTFLPKRWTV